MKRKLVSAMTLTLLLTSMLTLRFVVQTVKTSEPEPFSDEFDTAFLDERWTIVDPDGGSTFDLAPNPDWLRIATIAPPGRDLLPMKFNSPRIVQNTSGDFIIETRISSVMDENDEGAGILICRDSNNYVRLDRMSRTIGNPVEQQILFGGSVNGVFPCPGDTHVVLPSNINPTYLELVRANNTLSGYWSSDGFTWNHVGIIPFAVNDPVYIGLAIINEYHEGTFFAGFDYFRIYTSENSWWNRNWQHRVRVNVTENSMCNLADFPIEVIFEHNGNVQPNGTDIRVVDNLVEIPSHVEECNNTHAKIIFETNLTALESKMIHIYYGNPNATAPSYPLVPLTIVQGNTGNAVIDNKVYIGWDFTSWGWSNNVELWNDFRIDFNGNGDLADENDLIKDYGSRQGGIGRHRVDVQAIGLGDYQGYIQTPIYIDISFVDVMLRVYRNNPWVETTQADHLFTFSPSWDYANYGLGSEQNIIDGENVTQITPSPPWHYPWNEMYISPVNPKWMAYRDSITREIFGSIGLNIGTAYNHFFAAKEGTDWDRCIFYDFGTPDPPLEPYDQPPDCRIYWYGDNSNNYTKIAETATILNNQPMIAAVPDTITVPDDLPTIQEAINNANTGDTVFVRNGTYYEYIVVNKTVSLIGESIESTVLNGTDIDPTIIVEANDVKISGFTFEGWTFQNILINATTGVTIVENKIVFNALGIDVENSVNATIENNIINGFGLDNIGIMLAYSSGCSIVNNTITNAVYDGIRLWFSSSNLIHQNLIKDNDYGIFFHEANLNTISENTISESGGPGIYIESSSTNEILHNSFIDNYNQAMIYDNSVNTWDDGYPSGGNYWSDYTGMDLFSGSFQNETVGDGIGDTPYAINANNTDGYPLMIPWGSLLGDVNGDGYVGIDDIYLVASHFSREVGDPEYNRVYDFNGDGYVGIDDIFTAASHFGEENP
jgi:parallel beta-helix repeat protein